MKADGIFIRDNRPLVTLVNFGEVPTYLFEAINHSFDHFFSSIKDELKSVPELSRISIANPTIKEEGDEENVFINELNIIPGQIVVGVTNKGIYNRSSNRYIFGFGGSSRALLSIYRFVKSGKNPNRIRERLAKEVIKVLSIAVGIPHCSNPGCILSYHRRVSDLDTNTVVCDHCRKGLIEAINFLIQD